jgi:hypothetical protein
MYHDDDYGEDDFEVPPDDLGASYACRLMLAADSGDADAYLFTLYDAMQTTSLTTRQWAVIGCLVRSCIDLLEEHEPGWQDSYAEGLALLIPAVEQ